MELYDIIENAIRYHKGILNIGNKVVEEIRYTIRWGMRDNPDIFWFAHQYQYDEASSTIHFQYTFSADRVKTIQQSINDVIENDFCIEHVKKLSQQEQVAYVYKWLVSYCNYNANSAYNQSIYSVFVRRNSVCTGYAKAAQYLFKLLGIESRLVFGRLHNDKDDGRHCWNLIKVGKEYYHFDACFGDSILDNVAIKSGVQELFKIDGVNYNFLCVSTDEILRTRSIEDITTLPECPNSWPKTLVKSLAQTDLKQREGIRGCLLSHIGSSADTYLCTKDKNTVLKVFRSNSKTTSQEEYHYMQQTKGCRHLLQCNEDYTDITHNIVAIEQSTPIVDLLCSHYYELSLKGLIKIATDVAKAWKECQERGVLYRDIHVCNIYRSNDGTFKLGDFGSCTNDFDIEETVGNQWFMAPETFVSSVFTEASAVYSISMVMYFILNNLRPAFWAQGCEDEALKKRMNGQNLPTPAGCINLPPHIKTKLDKFFRVASKERISNVAEFICELEKLISCSEESDYIIHCNGFSLDFNLDAENNDAVEQMCTTASSLPTSDYTSDIVLDDEIISVDEVEGFASTRGGWNDECDSVEPCNSPATEQSSDLKVDEVESLSRSYAHDLDSDSSLNFDNISIITPFENPNFEEPSDDCYMNDSLTTTNSGLFTYESKLKNKSTDILKTANLKREYEKTITCLTRQQEQLKSVQSQIDELKKNKKELEIQLKNSPGMIKRAVGMVLFSIIKGLAGMGGGLAHAVPPGPTAQIFDEYRKLLLLECEECDKELEAKMAQALMCKKQIEDFIQQKNKLEKENAILEEQNIYNEVYSSIFAPAEVKRKSHLLVQVYLHLYEETDIVKSFAKEPDKNAERRDYIPLSLKLKKGDKVDVEFNIYGETRLASERKSIIWQGSFAKCTFDYFVPKDLDVDELSCEANLFVNGAMIGEMRFLTQIVEVPRKLNPEILTKSFKKIFISYAHNDFDKVKFMAKAYNAQGVDYFFDRDYLKAGDIYPKKIRDYIDTSDLFILCWSENAAKSEYVEKEKSQALSLAKNTDEENGTLTIHPLSIEPRADLPSDMKEIYNFEVI